ncbi:MULTISPECIES: PRC-barrel domain-containing protein [Streptomyces]|uniref:PRC-barrel domain-containing protein n=1 Tax=Streptomyces achmelvichensis TaxID=3134111 RepID=A0ACC6PQP1_9ACTN|nr:MULTISPECIES: PRC-barrel domain-containing protein [unclassified Streptomyces]WNO75824.1 PRC-barrel domain-containing protein [Streptomyces sp. AM8-1-1]WST36689.1 PRC-barrel domain-containing protein [Streptomyces sp. NBC_01167]
MCTFVSFTEQLRPLGGTVQTDIDPRSLIGRKAFDRNGAKIGTVDEVYLDDATGVPEWAAVRTGLFSRDAFVPLEPSEFVDNGLRVPYERALIKDAPDFGVGRHLSPEQELQLYHHYGLDLSTPPDTPAPSSGDRSFGRVAGQED